MSRNLLMREKNESLERNPKNFKLGLSLLTVAEVKEQCARKIQKCVRSRNLIRAKKRMEQIENNQVYHTQLMNNLRQKLLHDEPCTELILATNDQEVAATVSDVDK